MFHPRPRSGVGGLDVGQTITPMRTILKICYIVGLATVSVFLILDKVSVYPTEDSGVRFGLNFAISLFIFTLIAGEHYHWAWSRRAGLIFLSMVFVIDAIGTVFNGVSVHWPGLALSISGLPYLVHHLICKEKQPNKAVQRSP